MFAPYWGSFLWLVGRCCEFLSFGKSPTYAPFQLSGVCLPNLVTVRPEHTHTQACTQACTHRHTHTSTHTGTHTGTHTQAHTHRHTHRHTYTGTHTQARKHTQARTHRHTDLTVVCPSTLSNDLGYLFSPLSRS